jgi:hypothetical protein
LQCYQLCLFSLLTPDFSPGLLSALQVFGGEQVTYKECLLFFVFQFRNYRLSHKQGILELVQEIPGCLVFNNTENKTSQALSPIDRAESLANS